MSRELDLTFVRRKTRQTRREAAMLVEITKQPLRDGRRVILSGQVVI